MANEIEKVNGIAVADIEKINGKTDANIQALNGFEFTGSVTITEDMPCSAEYEYSVSTSKWSAAWLYRSGVKNKVLATYQDAANTNAIIEVLTLPGSDGATAGGNIAVGSSATFGAVHASYQAAVDTDPNTDNEAVVIHADNDDGNDGKVARAVVDAADESISFGTEVEFTSNAAHARVAHDKNRAGDFLIFWREGNPYPLYVRAGTTSGTTITLGTATRVKDDDGGSDMSGYYLNVKADPNNAGKYVLHYRTPTPDPDVVYCQVVTVSGTTVTFGAASAPGSDHGYNTTDAAVTWDNKTADKIHTCYSDINNSYYPTICAGTVDGTDITWGTPEVFESVYSETCSVSSDFFIANAGFAVREKGDSGARHTKVFAWTIDGTDYTMGTSHEASPNASTGGGSIAASPHAAGLHLLLYKDNSSTSPAYEGRLITYLHGGTY